MKQMNRVILSSMTAALACAAMAASAPDRNAVPPTQLIGAPLSADTGHQDAASVVAAWPAKTRKAAQALIQKYGPPDGVTDRMLVWNDKDQWKEVAVYRDVVIHSKPMPHQDFVENTIVYQVPESKVADLIKFDHSLVIDETRGTLASHCGSEGSNTLALNLANEIVTGKRDVASAQDFLKSTLMKSMAGKSSPYMEKLMFSSSPKQIMPGMPGMNEEPKNETNTQSPEAPATGY